MLNYLSMLFLIIAIFALLFLLFFGSLSVLLKKPGVRIMQDEEKPKKEKKHYFDSNFDSDVEDYLKGFKNQEI